MASLVICIRFMKLIVIYMTLICFLGITWKIWRTTEDLTLQSRVAERSIDMETAKLRKYERPDKRELKIHDFNMDENNYDQDNYHSKEEEKEKGGNHDIQLIADKELNQEPVHRDDKTRQIKDETKEDEIKVNDKMMHIEPIFRGKGGIKRSTELPIPGIIPVNFTEPKTFDDIPAIFNSTPALQPGGKWVPDDYICKMRCHLAVILPYRGRERNLKLILQHLHGFLQKQCISYQMFVIEPENTLIFNRGMLKNIGFAESQIYANFPCVTFHDIDVLPDNINNVYACEESPRHLMTALDTSFYKLLEGGTNLFGGAVIFNTTLFHKLNGYSNLYLDWGSEDTDLMYRVVSHGYKILRSNTTIGRYREAKHTKDDKRPIRNQVLHARGMHRFHDEGLNTMIYEVIDSILYPGYTWIHVKYNDTKYLEDGDAFVLKTDQELGQNLTKYMHIQDKQSYPPR